MTEATAIWIQAIAELGTLVTAVVVGWLAYKQYLKEEHIPASENRLEVFSTSKQTTELRATEDGLELHLYDRRPGRGGLQWSLSRQQVREILREDDIAVLPESKHKNAGVFSIGPKERWLYSRRLYPSPKQLYKDIRELLEVVD